jgi:type IV pilus assembly protein PilM
MCECQKRSFTSLLGLAHYLKKRGEKMNIFKTNIKPEFNINTLAVERFLKGADKKIILEIGNHNIKLIEIQKAEKIEVSKGFIISTPENAIEEDRIIDISSLAKVIKGKIKEEKIFTRELTVSVASKEIITREISLPYMRKDDLNNVIKMNSEDLFPVKLENYSLGYSIIEEYTEKEGILNRILVAAIPKEIIVPYIELAQQLKLSLKGFNFSGYELYNFMDFELENKEDNYVVIDIGSKNTNFIIVSNGVLKFNRVIKIGSEKVTELIAKKLNCDYVKAEKLKRQYNSVIILGNLESNSEVYIVAKMMQKVIEEIIQELSRIVEFYNSNNVKQKVNKIYVTGLPSRVSGIEEYIENITGMSVKRIRDLSKVSFNAKARALKGKQLTLVNCLGTEQLTNRKFVFLKGDLKLTNFLLILDPKFYKVGICIILLVLLFASAINFNIFLINKEADKYDSFLRSKVAISKLQNEINATTTSINKKKQVINSIENGAENIGDKLGIIDNVIADMSNKAVIEINKYNVKSTNIVEIKCSAKISKNAPNDYIIYNAPFDFADKLREHFDLPDPGNNPEDFTLTLTVKPNKT